MRLRLAALIAVAAFSVSTLAAYADTLYTYTYTGNPIVESTSSCVGPVCGGFGEPAGPPLPPLPSGGFISGYFTTDGPISTATPGMVVFVTPVSLYSTAGGVEPFSASNFEMIVDPSLLAVLKPRDVLLTPKLDRMFRSALDALDVLAQLQKAGISLHMIDLGGDVTGNGISNSYSRSFRP